LVLTPFYMVTQQPEFFYRGPSPFVRLLFFSVLALAIMVADARFHTLDMARAAVATVTYPLQQVALAPGEIFGRVGDFFVTQNKLQRENVELKQTLLKKSEDLQRLSLLENEISNLRKLLGARDAIRERSILAEILHSGRNAFRRKVIVDKGIKDDVQLGEAVISTDGVLGQVTAVFPFTSEVTLLTDKNQAVPVMLKRNGLRAVVFGNGRDGTLDLPFIPLNADVQNGDILVTSGIDGTYPSGLSVAKVTNIERNAIHAFAKITCLPLAGVDRDRYILVLTNLSAAAKPQIEPEAPKSPLGKSSKSTMKPVKP
jgi:rod shape-determining protein MreC